MFREYGCFCVKACLHEEYELWYDRKLSKTIISFEIKAKFYLVENHWNRFLECQRVASKIWSYFHKIAFPKLAAGDDIQESLTTRATLVVTIKRADNWRCTICNSHDDDVEKLSKSRWKSDYQDVILLNTSCSDAETCRGRIFVKEVSLRLSLTMVATWIVFHKSRVIRARNLLFNTNSAN